MITVVGITFCIPLHCRNAFFCCFFFHNYKSRYFGDCQQGIWGLCYCKRALGYSGALLWNNLQYCAKVMRAKCANFVLCLRDFSKKIRTKIWASFHNVLRVISLTPRTKIPRIFETRTKIPYQRAECEISQCSELTNIEPTMFRCLVNNHGHVDALLLTDVNVLINSSFMAKNFNPLTVFNDTSSQT